MALAAGCAHAPKGVGSGAGARASFLASCAAPHGPTRGVAPISLERSDGSHGSARVRWAANAESLVLFGYVGPARALNASLLEDSLFVVIPRFDLGVSGSLRDEGGEVGARLLRFLATPWDFSAPWTRSAVEHASVEETGRGWLLAGAFGRLEQPRQELLFTLEIGPSGEPIRLALRKEKEKTDLLSVRYGPIHRFDAGRIPSWSEWKLPGSTVRLTIEDYAPADPDKIRYAPTLDPEWRIRSLNTPEGRALVRWLLGLSEEEESGR